MVDDKHPNQYLRKLCCSENLINDRLGSDLSAADLQKLLQNVEFEVERTDNKY